MAVTLRMLRQMLDELELNYDVASDTEIALGFQTHNYRNLNGEPSLLMVLALEEDGEYFKAFCPQAFRATGEHADVFLKLCLIIQWQTKLIQFEYDHTDGEIRPIVEFPLEDASMTTTQLARVIYGMAGLLDEYYPVMAHALSTGEIRASLFPGIWANLEPGGLSSVDADREEEEVHRLMSALRIFGLRSDKDSGKPN